VGADGRGKAQGAVGMTGKPTIKNEKPIPELLEALKSRDDTERYSSFEVLLRLSEQQPELLYPRWDFLANMLDSDNAYWKLIAVRLLANLTRVDAEDRFEKIFDKYYNLLGDSVIVAGHITANSGKIARSKPELQAKITDRLLNIDKTSQKHKDLIKAGAIESFGEYFAESGDKEKIIGFVKQQLDCESPKTRKKAKEFLKKWGD
jgi:hypothetical protein